MDRIIITESLEHYYDFWVVTQVLFSCSIVKQTAKHISATRAFRHFSCLLFYHLCCCSAVPCCVHDTKTLTLIFLTFNFPFLRKTQTFGNKLNGYNNSCILSHILSAWINISGIIIILDRRKNWILFNGREEIWRIESVDFFLSSLVLLLLSRVVIGDGGACSCHRTMCYLTIQRYKLGKKHKLGDNATITTTGCSKWNSSLSSRTNDYICFITLKTFHLIGEQVQLLLLRSFKNFTWRQGCQQLIWGKKQRKFKTSLLRNYTFAVHTMHM